MVKVYTPRLFIEVAKERTAVHVGAQVYDTGRDTSYIEWYKKLEYPAGFNNISIEAKPRTRFGIMRLGDRIIVDVSWPEREPEVCVEDASEKDKGIIKYVCNIDLLGESSRYLNMEVRERFEKLKKALEIIKNTDKETYEDIMRYTDRFILAAKRRFDTNLGVFVYGAAREFGGYLNMILYPDLFDEPPERIAKTIVHEYAHLKEMSVRSLKGMSSRLEGKWKLEGNEIKPVGSELRAVKRTIRFAKLLG